MTASDSTGGADFELSPQARNEVALAIGAYLSQRSTDGEGHLRHAAYRVSGEAGRLGVSADQMVLAVKHLFARAPRISGDVQKRVELFERFVRYCLEAYEARHADVP